MVDPVHTYRPRNSVYIHTVRCYIYKYRKPEHPHLTIRHYKWRPQGTPDLWPHYMESCPDTARLYATFTSTLLASTPLSKELHAQFLNHEPVQIFFIYPTQALSLASIFLYWSPSPFLIRLRFSELIWFDPTPPIQFNSEVPILFKSCCSNVFIRVTIDSHHREYQIG